MKKLSLTLACALCIFLLASAPGAAKEIRGTFSGSALQSIDSDDDGSNASHNHAVGRSNLGRSEARDFSELLPFGGSSCSPTELLFEYANNTGVTRYEDGSLLLSRLVSGILCSSLLDNTFTFDIEREITGGTGRFEGASGSLFISGSGQSAGAGASGFTGTVSGTLILP